MYKQYIKSYYYTCPTLQKFDKIMMSNNKKEIINLGKYLYHANNRRNQLDN